MRLILGQPLDDAALVLPVRPGAELALGSDAAFDRLGALTAPRVEERRRYHLGFEPTVAATWTARPRAPRPAGAEGVDVLGSQALGPLRVVTLRSRSAAAMEAWLRDTASRCRTASPPARRATSTTAGTSSSAELRPEAAGTPLVELQPLAVRFPTRRPVYPLRLSRLAALGSSARVDLLAPWKAAVEGYGDVVEEAPGRPPGPGAALIYAGRAAGGTSARRCPRASSPASASRSTPARPTATRRSTAPTTSSPTARSGSSTTTCTSAARSCPSRRWSRSPRPRRCGWSGAGGSALQRPDPAESGAPRAYRSQRALSCAAR